ncbi:MAG: invasion associated locus B family protein [bacterium]
MTFLLKRRKDMLALMTLFVLLMSSSITFAAPKQGQQFRDWVTVCQQIPGQKKQHCHIAQTASDKVTQQVVLHTMIGYLVGSKEPVAIFIIPAKLKQKHKLTLAFDHNFSAEFTVQSCEKDACNAGVPLDQPMMAAFKKGKVAYLKYKDGKKDKKIPISLLGVTAGLKALK